MGALTIHVVKKEKIKGIPSEKIIFGRLLPKCVVAEHIDGSPFLHDMDIKRALRNKVFLSLPEILCE